MTFLPLQWWGGQTTSWPVLIDQEQAEMNFSYNGKVVPFLVLEGSVGSSSLQKLLLIQQANPTMFSLFTIKCI